MQRQPIIVLATIAVTACSAPRVAVGSAQECVLSLKRVSDAAFGTADSAAFASALLRIVGSLAYRGMSRALTAFGSADAVSVAAPPIDSTLIQGAVCEGFAGASARDILQHTDSLEQRVGAAFDRRHGVAYLDALNAAKASFGRVRDSLALFAVESARLDQSGGFLGLETTITITVRNGTSYSIRRAYFHSVARSDGREVAWLEAPFNYPIPGGLAPGERATWSLRPNQFLDNWNKVLVPRGARFTVEVVKLDGADGEPLWGGPTFTKSDQQLRDSLSRIAARE